MAAAYNIVLEKKIDGLNTLMDGKSLVWNIEALITAARQLGVRPLTDFFSVPPERVVSFMKVVGMDAAGVEIPPLRYYPATEGLTTVQALLKNPPTHDVVSDLQDCERILLAAAQSGAGWRFVIDL